jgi:hypothetical protein
MSVMTSELKPWKGVCCKACWFAKGNRCRCRCKGANHQHGLTKQLVEHMADRAVEQLTAQAQNDARSESIVRKMTEAKIRKELGGE